MPDNSAGLQECRRLLEETRAVQAQLRAELRARTDENLLLEELSATLSGAADLEDCLERVLQSVLRLVECQSAAVFLEEDELLVPAGFTGPFATRLREARLLRSREPIVEEAWARGRPVWLPPGGELRDRIFDGETVALALPLRGCGVLYLGRPGDQALATEQVRLLGVLADQAAMALASARHREEVREAVERTAAAHGRLERWTAQMGGLVEGFRDLASILDPELLLDALQQQLRGLIPHQAQALVLEERSAHRGWADRGTPEADPGVLAALHRSGVPLLVDDLEKTRFHPLVEGQRSLLAVPLIREGRVLGAVLLGASAPGAFSREDRDLALLFAYQAALSLENARRHEETVEAYRKLQESEAQLLQSSKLSAVGQLAAGVAHEVNTPLGSVLLCLQLAEAALGEGSEPARARLETARKELHRIHTIVEKLLYYSRDAREGRAPTDLNQVVRDTLLLVGYQLRLDGVQTQLDLQPLERVCVNSNEMQQVVTNLLLNARDALKESGTPSPRIRVATEDVAGSVVLVVEDNGPGVPAEVRERIFDPFFTTRPVGRGTGLGLFISRQIATRHDGSLTLERPSSAGARFRLVLPRSH